MMRYFLIFCLLFKFSTVNSILIKADILKLQDKKIILLHDYHPYQEQNDNQLQSFWQTLAAAQIQSPYHVLIERPLLWSQIPIQDPAILDNIWQSIFDHKLQNLSIEDIEIRCKSIPACVILDRVEEIPLPEAFLFLLGNEVSILNRITFQDIINEFISWYNKLHTFIIKENINKDFRDECLMRLNFAYRDFLEILKLLKKFKIDKSTPLINCSPNHEFFNIKFCRMISAYITEAFCPLLDLNIIKSILNNIDKNIIVIAGSRHMNNVKYMLGKITDSIFINDVDKQPDNSEFFIKGDFPLEKEDFDKIFSTSFEQYSQLHQLCSII